MNWVSDYWGTTTIVMDLCTVGDKAVCHVEIQIGLASFFPGRRRWQNKRTPE
jgi:hypothetical protein